MKLPRLPQPRRQTNEEERLFVEANEAQFWVCRRWAAPYLPTDGRALVAISPLVLEGHLPVEGSRIRGRGENSGWIIFAGDRDEEVADLIREHAVHLATKRPDLLRYLGLPAGWRFYCDAAGENVWEAEREEQGG
jgi:hypothetical protein